ncbi:protein yellow-like isoform X2 [Cloeon dipterum]|uniref:protein yellow-like isoform X2 n=1 Tax=Cloeon dipterum TaxID=197152 RepID=UPI00321FDC1E
MRLAGRMTPFFIPIFLLGLSSLVNAANFTQVFEWNNEKNYNTTKASLEAEIFNPRRIMPFFMAAYGPRLFFSMFRVLSTPVTLVSLHTSSASSASPKFTPFPSLNIHGQGDCDKLGEASGLQVDSVGRLWVLDQGSFRCSSKIWTIDLKNNDQTKLTHRFSFQNLIHDFVLDETPNGTFAYITEMGAQHIVVFSLERNESWIVDTPGKSLLTIALSPKVEPRKLYLSEYESSRLYSISIAALRNGSRTANPELIGNWTAEPYRMLMDNQGTLYAAFWGKNYISSWNSSQPFAEHRFYEVAGLNTDYPFSFNLDQSGAFWMAVFDDKSNILTVLLE